MFSGIGAQERGFENSGLFEIDLKSTSDICKEAVVSYAAIHCGLTNEMVDTYEDYPSREQMAQELAEINLGFDPDKNKRFDWFKLVKRKSSSLEKFWLANKLTKNLGDISKIEKLPYADLWTLSFPCTDISVAGKMKGLSPDGETRSSLLWCGINLLNIAKENAELPKYILFENVKNLVSKKFRPDFDNLIEVLSELGFNTYWKVLNGKECGIPQNRERVFVIAIRKDIDTEKMDFPKPFDNGLRLKDILEDEVNEKYYLSDKMTSKMKLNLGHQKNNNFIDIVGHSGSGGQKGWIHSVEGGVGSLSATDYKQPKQILTGIDKSVNNTKAIEYANCITAREDRGISNRKSEGTAVLEQVGQLYGTKKEPNPQAGRIYNSDGISPTLDSCSGGNRMPKILSNRNIDNLPDTQNFVKKKLKEIVHEKGFLPQMCNAYNKTEITDYAPTQTANCGTTPRIAAVLLNNNYVIRKLTPTETWRLMGFEDEDAENVYSIGISDSAMYKQAGNSIITNCIELIAEHLYKAQYDNTYICYDEVR